MNTNKHFFDTVRPLFGGGMTQGQVDGLIRIMDYAEKWGYSAEDTAYVLATIWHETAQWMEPIREGARRYGPSYSDASAKRAVASIYGKGVIRVNYALPAGPYKQPYYGRGLVQITWYDNYKKFADLLGIPLDKNPDLALDWDVSLDICFLGMRDGLFTSKKMGDYAFPLEYNVARPIVNGDVKKYGKTIGDAALTFLSAMPDTLNRNGGRCEH
jgi:hypothetical protein